MLYTEINYIVEENVLGIFKQSLNLTFHLQLTGNGEMIDKLASSSLVSGKNNVAFLSFFIRGELEQCLELLISTRRMPEAAFFARSYLPSKLPQVRQHAIILEFDFQEP